MKRLISYMLAAAFTLCAVPAFADLWTAHAQNKIVDSVFRGQALDAPATWHLAFSTTACAAGVTEPAGNGYARASVAASLTAWAGTQAAGSTGASSGTSATTSNNSVISFAASTAPWGSLVSMLLYDSATGGNAWVCADLDLPFNVDRAGVTMRYDAGTLQFTVEGD